MTRSNRFVRAKFAGGAFENSFDPRVIRSAAKARIAANEKRGVKMDDDLFSGWTLEQIVNDPRGFVEGRLYLEEPQYEYDNSTAGRFMAWMQKRGWA
jgi:hypothetical protein